MHEFFIRDSESRVTVKGSVNGTRLVPENTILFVVRGMSLAQEFRIGVTRVPVTFNQDLKAICPSRDLVPLYLAYTLKALTPQIMSIVDEASHGTRRLATDALARLEIPIPPLDEQRCIAGILEAFDDKIELNRRMNHTLEVIARAIFKSWFVDFDPVWAKANGEQPHDMDAETAALFPDAFVESELGDIPEGWRLPELDEICDLKYGKFIAKKNLEPGPYPAFSGYGVIGMHNKDRRQNNFRKVGHM
jgi:type I restriction enzyme S subunit